MIYHFSVIQLSNVQVGLNDMVSEGEWVYSNGHAVTEGAYSNWGEGAPDGGREENCGALQPVATWDDRNCTIQLQFACSRGKGSEQVLQCVYQLLLMLFI